MREGVGRTGVVAELGPATAPLVALTKERARYRGRRVGLIQTGGNIDLRQVTVQVTPAGVPPPTARISGPNQGTTLSSWKRVSGE